MNKSRWSPKRSKTDVLVKIWLKQIGQHRAESPFLQNVRARFGHGGLNISVRGFGSKLTPRTSFAYFSLSLCTGTMVWPLLVRYFLHLRCLLCPFLCTGNMVWPLLQFSCCFVVLCICMLLDHCCAQGEMVLPLLHFYIVFCNIGKFEPRASQSDAPVHNSGWSTELSKTNDF